MDSPGGQKKRLDVWMVERGLTRSRESARRCIIAGQVRVNGQLVVHPSTPVAADANVHLQARLPYVSRGGIVRDPTVHLDVLRRITTWAITHRLVVRDAMPSPIRGADGNVEFLLHLATHAAPEQDVEALIARCMAEVP